MGSFRRFCRRVAAKMLPDTTPDSRLLARRQPLGDVTAAANNAATTTTTTNTTPPAAVPQGKKKPSLAAAPATTTTTTTTTTPTTAPTAPATTTRATRTLRTLSTALLFRRKKTSVGPWKLGRTLGKGANGKVKEARHVMTGEMAAVKIVRKERGEGGRWVVPGNVEREVAVMAVLGGLEEGNGEGDWKGEGRRGLVGLKDVFENGREVYLILTHHPHGDLHTYITTHGPLREPHALTLLTQLLSALTHLHAHHLSHRDLKPENILLSFPVLGAEPVLALADFGLAALSPPGTLHTTPCGSPHYVAPEIVLGRAYSGPGVDAWACGVVFYAMLTGTLPFAGAGTQRTLAKIAEGRWALPRGCRVSRVSRELLRGLLTREPGRRMSVEEAYVYVVEKTSVDGDTEKESEKENEYEKEKENGYEKENEKENEKKKEGRKFKRSEIDDGLLRALGSVWWWVGEEELLEQLTNEEPNEEKRFYEAMCRFRARADERYAVNR